MDLNHVVDQSQSRQNAKLFLKSLELGLPKPLTLRRVTPPRSVLGGGAHSMAREGLGESQFRQGDILYTVVLFIDTYFVGSMLQCLLLNTESCFSQNLMS